ncbi:hypothetical protein [Glycomyces halotolerans]
MPTLSLGVWIGAAATLPVLAVAFVAYLSLRGSKPGERADILRALAVFTAALFFRSPGPQLERRRSPASSEERQDGGEPPDRVCR